MYSLKKSKSNKYLSDIAIKSGLVKIDDNSKNTSLKYISVYTRLKDPLDFNQKFLLKYHNINSFDTCIEFLKTNENFSYSRKMRYLDICWSEYVKISEEISDNVVNYYRSFSNDYWKNVKKYDYNTWNNILISYFEKNKNIWNDIVFHTYKIKIFSEKY